MSDERRAEIEAGPYGTDVPEEAWAAFWSVLNERKTTVGPTPNYYAGKSIALALAAALDRVRDARGDDEDRCECKVRVAAPGERGERLSNGCPVHGAARSPQGEDHEAGIEAALEQWWGEPPSRATKRTVLEAAIPAYLARVSAPKADEKQEAR